MKTLTKITAFIMVMAFTLIPLFRIYSVDGVMQHYGSQQSPEDWPKLLIYIAVILLYLWLLTMVILAISSLHKLIKSMF